MRPFWGLTDRASQPVSQPVSWSFVHLISQSVSQSVTKSDGFRFSKVGQQLTVFILHSFSQLCLAQKCQIIVKKYPSSFIITLGCTFKMASAAFHCRNTALSHRSNPHITHLPLSLKQHQTLASSPETKQTSVTLDSECVSMQSTEDSWLCRWRSWCWCAEVGWLPGLRAVQRY